jgi:hypothetical protein
MVVMTWRLVPGPGGKPQLHPTWNPVVVPAPRNAQEDHTPIPALRAS